MEQIKPGLRSDCRLQYFLLLHPVSSIDKGNDYFTNTAMIVDAADKKHAQEEQRSPDSSAAHCIKIFGSVIRSDLVPVPGSLRTQSMPEK